MRLLLVEDEAAIQTSLTKALRENNYAVDVAGDGLKGEELATVHEYDLIVLDVMLPKQDGWTTCANIRRAGIRTPVLMLTALGEVSDRIKGLDQGADDYLVKPFHLGELLARIRSLTRRRTDVRTTVLEHYGLSLDASTHKVTREGKEIALTAKEFALLELFMLNAGKIVSRETISEHLWDMNFDPRSNVIESFVRFLRQKVDRGFSPQLIRTVRGAGYVFTNEPT